MQHAPLSLSMPEDDANSASSHDDGSSADETTPAVASSSQNGDTQVAGKKRKRTKYQKTSYVLICPLLYRPYLLCRLSYPISPRLFTGIVILFRGFSSSYYLISLLVIHVMASHNE